MIEYVNRVRVEKEEEFEESIFCDVYKNAHFMVKQIIKQNLLCDKENELDYFCNENYIANVISFLGERGMGKSSAMLSFAYHLKNYNFSKAPENKDIKNYRYDDAKFYVMPKIDAAILAKGEGLFDVVLANLWDKFKIYDGGYYEKGYEYEQIRNKFKSIKSTYSEYLKQYGKEKNEVDSYMELHELNHVLNLRRNFHELVITYLRYIDTKQYVNYNKLFLVFPIDDIDLANDGSYSVLEQLRMFFSIPHVIILTTADMDRLALNLKTVLSSRLLYSDNCDEDDLKIISRYRYDYLSKVIPRNMRIYMPLLAEFSNPIYNEVKDYVHYIYIKEYNPSNVDAERFIKLLLAKKLHILVGPKLKCFSLVSGSLRNDVNTLSEVVGLLNYEQENVNRVSIFYQWYKKVLTISAENMQNDDFKWAIRDLWKLPDSTINYYMKRIGRKSYSTEEAAIGSYSEVINRIEELENIRPLNLEGIQRCILVYSMRIRQAMGLDKGIENNEGNISNYYGESVFSYLKLNGQYSLSFRISIEMFVDMPFDFDIKDGEKVNLQTFLNMGNNKEKCIEVFVVSLFLNIDKMPNVKLIGVNGAEKNADGDVQKVVLGTPKTVTFEVDEQGDTLYSGVIDGSVDVFFRRIINCEDLWNQYYEWLLNGLNIEYTEEEKENAEQELRRELDKIISIEKIKEWIKKYNIKCMYDFIPIQNVDIMVDVLKKLKDNYSIRLKENSIVNNAGVIIDVLCDIYKEVEKEYHTEYMDDPEVEYCNKLLELRNAVNLTQLDFESHVIPATRNNAMTELDEE